MSRVKTLNNNEFDHKHWPCGLPVADIELGVCVAFYLVYSYISVINKR